jgi:hypothetical protein
LLFSLCTNLKSQNFENAVTYTETYKIFAREVGFQCQEMLVRISFLMISSIPETFFWFTIQKVNVTPLLLPPGENKMDKFEKATKDLAKMSPAEMTKALNAEKAKCTCPSCPTYTNCAKKAGELYFCGSGKSFMCVDKDNGCICPKCPVTADVGLKYKSFCLRGSEKAQRYENTLWGSKVL